MLNKACSQIRKITRVLIAGIVIAFLGLLSAIYSSLASYSPLRHLLPFRWFFTLKYYRNSLKGISRLETMKPNNREYYASIDGSTESIGIITNKDEGFKELQLALKQEKLISEPIDKIELLKWNRSAYSFDNSQPFEEMRLQLKMLRNKIVVKEFPIESVT